MAHDSMCDTVLSITPSNVVWRDKNAKTTDSRRTLSIPDGRVRSARTNFVRGFEKAGLTFWQPGCLRSLQREFLSDSVRPETQNSLSLFQSTILTFGA